MEEELKPLLFRGQSAEWVVLKPPTKDEIRDSWVVKFIFEPDFEHARMWTEIVCGGPGCENILEAGSRVVLVAKAGNPTLKLWFCSMQCQRRNHVEVAVRRRIDPPGPI